MFGLCVDGSIRCLNAFGQIICCNRNLQQWNHTRYRNRQYEETTPYKVGRRTIYHQLVNYQKKTAANQAFYDIQNR